MAGDESLKNFKEPEGVNRTATLASSLIPDLESGTHLFPQPLTLLTI